MHVYRYSTLLSLFPPLKREKGTNTAEVARDSNVRGAIPEIEKLSYKQTVIMHRNVLKIRQVN